MLKQKRGMGIVTAASIIAEIVDIRRFVREDNLAGYAGLGRREHSTGDSTREVASQTFNRRLKDALITAARNYVQFNPDSHLAGYYRNLVKKGMTHLEATKRVARALVRVIFRQLYALQESDTDPLEAQGSQEGESDAASGVTRSGRSHSSNTSPSSLRSNRPPRASKVKHRSTRRSTAARRRKNAASEKTA